MHTETECGTEASRTSGDSVNGLAVCAGVGGLELALELVFGDAYRTVCFVEREAFVCADLVARMDEGILCQAPIWDDLDSFDGRRWRGLVDIVTAGFPCQPFSVAGQQKGLDDERWLWPSIERIIRDVRPRLVFLENVPPLVVHGLGAVLGTLAKLGFDAEWGLLSAADVGGSHGRERFYLLAVADASCGGLRELRESSGRPGQPKAASLLGVEVSALADAQHAGQFGRSARHDGNRSDAPGDDVDGYHPLFPPGPGDIAAWRAILERWPDLAPALENPTRYREHRQARDDGGRGRGVSEAGDADVRDVEHAADALQHPEREEPEDSERGRAQLEARTLTAGSGLDLDQGQAATESTVRGVAHELAPRVDRLRACGNGVVPLAAAVAFCTLADRLGYPVRPS